MTTSTSNSAVSAVSSGNVASDSLFNGEEYSIHDEQGAPEGAVCASTHGEAASEWALENLRNGESKRLSVIGRGEWRARWFVVERLRDSAIAKPCTEYSL